MLFPLGEQVLLRIESMLLPDGQTFPKRQEFWKILCLSLCTEATTPPLGHCFYLVTLISGRSLVKLM